MARRFNAPKEGLDSLPHHVSVDDGCLRQPAVLDGCFEVTKERLGGEHPRGTQRPPLADLGSQVTRQVHHDHLLTAWECASTSARASAAWISRLSRSCKGST